MEDLTFGSFKEDKAKAESKILFAIKELEDKYSVTVYRVDSTTTMILREPCLKTTCVKLEVQI
jgi:hypothetical protein